MLSSEQGVYIAESVSVKNTKQAKGRFRVYDDQDDLVSFCKYLLFEILLSSLEIFGN